MFWTRLRLFIASVVVLAEVQGWKWWCRCHWLLYPFLWARGLATPVPFWWHISWNIFCWFFFCQWLSLLFSPRPGLDLDQSALVLDLLFSVSLEAFWTTPLRRLSQTETRWVSESERERVISVELCAFTGTAYYATPYVNKVTVWCNNVLDCFTVGSLLLCFLLLFLFLFLFL